MKRYSFTAEADVPIEFDHPGRFFTLLQCVSPIDVSLQQGGAQPEVLESITPGIWADFGDKPFTRIRVVSHAAQQIAFMVSMIRAGWSNPPPSCSSNEVRLDGLAASASATTPVIDLGEDWAASIVALQAELTASAGGAMSLWCADASTMFEKRMCLGQGYQGVAYTTTSSSNHHLSSLRPTGRFLQGTFTNGATIQSGTAKKLVVHVMRNISA